MLQIYAIWQDLTVPDALVEVFSSGTTLYGDPISGPFDIQPRSLQLVSNARIMNGTSYPVGIDQYFQLVMIDDKIEAIEGLIVDTRIGNASIGFRNHTLPVGTSPGGSWKEVSPDVNADV